VAITSDPNEPKTFHQAWNHQDLTEKDGWRSAIQTELANMEKRNVWQIINQSIMPKERKVIGCRWVFKKKRNGDQRARLVAQGFSQVPGVDFSENFAPVIDDTSFRIVLSLIQKWGYQAFALDVETAFLHGTLEEEIYMRIPEGYDPEELRGEKRVLILKDQSMAWYRQPDNGGRDLILRLSNLASNPIIWILVCSSKKMKKEECLSPCMLMTLSLLVRNV
jgi:hypothetical protein